MKLALQTGRSPGEIGDAWTAAEITEAIAYHEIEAEAARKAADERSIREKMAAANRRRPRR